MKLKLALLSFILSLNISYAQQLPYTSVRGININGFGVNKVLSNTDYSNLTSGSTVPVPLTNPNGSADSMTVKPGTVAQTLNDKSKEILSVLDYGAKCDGVTDDSTSIQNAINAAPGMHRQKVYIPGICAIASTIVIGNGTPTTISTVNGVVLEGSGNPFSRLNLAGLGKIGSQLKWIGALGGTMVRIVGPSDGNGLEHVALDANYLANTTLQMVSANTGYFPSLVIANYRGVGLDITTQPSNNLPNDDSAELSSEGNVFTDLRAVSEIVGSTSIKMNGYTSGDLDPVRNTFTSVLLSVPGTNSTGLYLGFTDQNTFRDFNITQNGTYDGTSCAIDFHPTTTYSSSHPTSPYVWPQNNVFIGATDTGQHIPICGETLTAAPGPGNRMDNVTGLDNQTMPRDPVTRSLTSEHVEPGQFPYGNYRSISGQNVLERSWRNAFINPNFQVTTRGTSFSNPPSGVNTLDGWMPIYNGTVANRTIQRITADRTLGALPSSVKYAISFPVGGQSNGDTNALCQRIEGISKYSNRLVNLSAYMVGNGGTPNVTATLYIVYGNQAGSAAPQFVSSTSPVVKTSVAKWQRFAFVFQMPYIADSYVTSPNYIQACINPDPGSYQGGPYPLLIAAPQFELGQIDTAYETRPVEIEHTLAQKRLQISGTGSTGAWFNTTGGLTVGLKFITSMACSNPTISLASSNLPVVAISPGSNVYTSNTPGINASYVSSTGAVVTLNGFSPATTVNQTAILGTDNIMASCEL